MKLRQVNEDSLELRHSRVVDVYRNGRKPVFRMTLADGKQIEATSDHRFLFADGWGTLGRRTGLREQAGRAVWQEGDHFLYVNGATEERPPLYRDPVWLQREYRGHRRPISDLAEACGVSYHTIRKWLTRYDLTDRGRGRFAEANVPWNRGETYRLGPRKSSELWAAANREARTRSASNIWQGGRATGRIGPREYRRRHAARTLLR